MTEPMIQRETRSVEDMLVAAKVLAKDGKAQESTCKSCHIPVWLSFFFDGTGNHRDNDFPLTHSNVAALYDAHKFDPNNGYVRFYYEGIGTAFKFEKYSEVNPLALQGIHTDKYQRLNIRNNINNASTRPDPRDPQNRTFGYTDSQYGLAATANQGTASGIKQRLQKALFEMVAYLEEVYQQKGITQINISAFGFSRGATEARIFVNWLKYAPNVTSKAGKLVYRDKVPIVVKFLGIFDTVESIGAAGKNLNKDIYKTSIGTHIERSAHLVASIELRRAFPLTPSNRAQPATVKEQYHCQIVYPGAHSNIGGGYADKEQERSNGLSRITLLKMLDLARISQVPLLSLKEMPAHPDWNKRLKYSFAVPARHQQALDKFLTCVGAYQNTLPSIIEAHTRLYHQWINDGLYLEFINKKIKQLNDKKRNNLEEDNLDTFQKAILLNKNSIYRYQSRPTNKTKTVDLAAQKLNPDVISFFENYVCDSIAGFVMGGSAMIVSPDLGNPDYFIFRPLFNPS